MSKNWALWAGAAFGVGALIPGAAQAQQGGGPFADVPMGHWAYDAVTQLAQKGIFTGYPDGTFQGRRALTRYEFAVALQRMLTEVQREIAAANLKGPQGNPGERGPAGATGARGPRGAAGPVGPSGVPPEVLQDILRQQGLMRSDIAALQKLAQEFSSELAMLGADVEQIKRNLNALADRVTRLEATVARIPKITGAVNIGFRADGVTAKTPGFNNVGNAAIPGLVDRDGRLLNASNSLLNRVNAFYDIDLGITANVSDVATARLLLNAGNYLRGYLGGRISQVNPLIDGGVDGKTDTPNFTTEDVIPYYLYLETPVKIGGVGTQITVGKFGHQFTPYTLKMADVDSYFYNDKTDLGDYPITGGRVNFRALGLNFSAYAGVHQNDYAQLTSTAGFLMPGFYSPDLNRFQPQGSSGPLIGIGSSLIDQSAGVRATYVGKRFEIGGTYLAGAAGTSDLPGVSDQFRELQVYGVDFRVTPWKHIGFSGAVTESKWTARVGGNLQGQFGVGPNDRRAWDLRADFPLWKALAQIYYKRIGAGFDAPGSWGRLGDWINPRGIEGFGGSLEVPIGHRLTLEFEGADYNYTAFKNFGAPASNLFYARGGLRYPLSARNTVDVGYELVDYQADALDAVKREEQYYNLGITHQFSPNLSVRMLYQLENVHSRGVLDVPGFNYQANIFITQFQARF